MSFSDEDPLQEQPSDSSTAEPPLGGGNDRRPSGANRWLSRQLRRTIALLDEIIAALETYPAPRSQVGSWFQAIAIPLQILGRQLLLSIRRRLPPGVQQTLSDSVLTGITLAVVVVGIWLVLSVLPGKPTVATAPIAPSVATCPPCDQTPTAVATAPPEPESTTITPPVAEPAPRPEPKPVSPPAPPPPAELTPEQSLLAAIQSDIAEVSVQYADGLVQSVQANFSQGRLVVTVSDEWYSLDLNRQERLGAEWLSQARRLDFVRLELRDQQGTLLARSPVVGSTLVILQPVRPRSQPPTTP